MKMLHNIYHLMASCGINDTTYIVDPEAVKRGMRVDSPSVSCSSSRRQVVNEEREEQQEADHTISCEK
jgi:hypothetical protein